MTAKLFSNEMPLRMLTTKLNEIKQRVNEAAAASGLTDGVRIIGVVKYQTVEDANALIASGIRDIAENHVQALRERAPLFLPSQKHLIGHLQTNKAKQAVLLADMIQSVDSLHLLSELEKQAAAAGKKQSILFQVNIAREETKTGVFKEGLQELIEAAADMPHIAVRGLMSIMPIETKLLYYQEMYNLFIDKREYLVHNIDTENISMDYLSMGMSGDYEPAVRCGANMIRLGRCLFE